MEDKEDEISSPGFGPLFIIEETGDTDRTIVEPSNGNQNPTGHSFTEKQLKQSAISKPYLQEMDVLLKSCEKLTGIPFRSRHIEGYSKTSLSRPSCIRGKEEVRPETYGEACSPPQADRSSCYIDTQMDGTQTENEPAEGQSLCTVIHRPGTSYCSEMPLSSAGNSLSDSMLEYEGQLLGIKAVELIAILKLEEDARREERKKEIHSLREERAEEERKTWKEKLNSLVLQLAEESSQLRSAQQEQLLELQAKLHHQSSGQTSNTQEELTDCRRNSCGDVEQYVQGGLKALEDRYEPVLVSLLKRKEATAGGVVKAKQQSQELRVQLKPLREEIQKLQLERTCLEERLKLTFMQRQEDTSHYKEAVHFLEESIRELRTELEIQKRKTKEMEELRESLTKQLMLYRCFMSERAHKTEEYRYITTDTHFNKAVTNL
ncbi:hypothetical protein GOODEAATRI_005378 [Goodea atripinnis]|uniref:Syncoilin n=1 Tax=Goodea atripinnis TaxID=208336 RepID=A0ABV0NSF2_9TELE